MPDAGASHPAQARYQNRLESGREAGPGRRRTSGIILRPGSGPGAVRGQAEGTMSETTGTVCRDMQDIAQNCDPSKSERESYEDTAVAQV
ncbi:unnamed protein product [Lasius platythorax]|uniref:Uncharacterized protein n=1 Tax=Lasius platythorax TaxID=488582 RepID=A0AAV2NWT1_9HYME